MNLFKNNYRIAKVVHYDGSVYYVPEKRGLFFFKSILPEHDPGYSNYTNANNAIIFNEIEEVSYEYVNPRSTQEST